MNLLVFDLSMMFVAGFLAAAGLYAFALSKRLFEPLFMIVASAGFAWLIFDTMSAAVSDDPFLIMILCCIFVAGMGTMKEVWKKYHKLFCS